MLWWILTGVSGLILLTHFRGPNAVWGTATLGVPVGIAVAFFQPEFEWATVGKSVVVAILIGFVFEWLPKIAARGKSPQ
jgi:hypothetical protein